MIQFFFKWLHWMIQSTAQCSYMCLIRVVGISQRLNEFSCLYGDLLFKYMIVQCDNFYYEWRIQRIIVWFLTKAGKNNKEISKEIREQSYAIYGEHALQNKAVKKWAGFQASQDSIGVGEYEVWPCSTCSVDNVQKVKLIVEMNHKVTREIAEYTSTSQETAPLILYEQFGTKKYMWRWYQESFHWPKTNAGGILREPVSCGCWKWNFILNRVVTGDKSWIYKYDLCNK